MVRRSLNMEGPLMRITLFAPKMGLRPMDSEYKRRMAPPLSLLTVAGLTPVQHTVSVQDENVAALRLAERTDLAGITVTVQTAPRAYAIADDLRARGIPVVLGGIHASANPHEALEHADAVCIGDAEGLWPGILLDAERGRLKGLYRHTRNPDLAGTPVPRWELVRRSRYLVSNLVCATRGCPHRCEFCYNSSAYVRGGCRLRPVSSVIEEVRRLGCRHVLFVDDNLAGDLPWVWELVRALAPMNVLWHAAVSANIVEHLDLLAAMQASGCRSLFIGFESIDGAALRSANKRQNRVETYGRLIEELHRLGIMIHASLVFGFDEDGPEVFDTTVDWLVRSRVETMTAHILTPYPGTRLFERFSAEGRIDDLDWSHYDTAHVVFRPKRMSKDELLSGYLRAYERFYSFRNIRKRLPEARQNRLPYLLFNLGYRKFGKFTSAFARLNGGMQAVTRFARRMSYGIE